MSLLILTGTLKYKLQDIGARIKGLPYKFGAEVNLKTPVDELVKKRTKIDCSEMIEWIFYQIGIRVPDGSYNQYDASTEIPENIMTVGDMVFKKRNDRVCHVGMIVQVQPKIVVLEAAGWYKKVIEKPFEKFKDTPNPKQAQYAGLRRFVREKVKIIEQEQTKEVKQCFSLKSFLLSFLQKVR